MTHYPVHIVGLVPISTSGEVEAVRVVTRSDVQWGTPIFRAPALPTPHQIHSDLPFTANLPSRFRTRTR